MDGQLIQQEENKDAHTIITIKKIEQEIRNQYSSLEEMSVLANPDLSKQNQILSKIEELQQLKTSMYESLSYSYASAQASVVEARDALADETTVAGIMQNELQIAGDNLESLKYERNNKIRMAEINDYYSSKYEAQSKIMKLIVYFCIPILLLAILMKKSLVPQNIGLTIIGILLGLAIVTVTLKVIDIMRRDNMVFDEYTFPFTIDKMAASPDTNDKDQPVKVDYTMSCIGNECCPTGNEYGTVWDAINKQCVTPTFKTAENNVPTDSEGFVGERCLQSSFDKPSTTVNIFKNNNQIDGYSSDIGDNYAKF